MTTILKTTRQTTDRRAGSPRAGATRAGALLALAALLALGGCDLFGGGRTYSGVVVDATSGQPVDSMHVSLKVGGGGFGTYTLLEAGFTGRDGGFRLHTDRQDASLYVNSPGYGGDAYYRPDYVSQGPVFYRDRGDIRVELQRQAP